MVPIDGFARNVKLLRLVDGDTIRIEIDLGWTIKTQCDVRLTGVDTPEPRGPERNAGRYVTDAVQAWIDEREGRQMAIRSDVFKVGKYGRCLCEVWIGDDCLNEWLLDEGLGWPMTSKGSVGTRRIDDLTGIPEGVKQLCREALA
jgi:micrococcal nuclease